MKFSIIIAGILLLVGCASVVSYKALEPVSATSVEVTTSTEIERQEVRVLRSEVSKAMAAPAPMITKTKIIEEPEVAFAMKEKTDVVTRNLFSASLAFVIPEKANVEDSIKAQLLIDTKKELIDLEKELTVKGTKTSKKIEISRIVKATISAPNFEVTNVTDTEQIISDNATTEWTWALKPKSAGTYDVNLVVTAIINYDGKEKTHHIKTFDKTVVIEITPKQVVNDWFADNWKWLISTLIIPFLGFLIKDKVKKLLSKE